MARRQVADVGTATNMERSCEYIDNAVADSRQGVILQFWGLGEVLTTPRRKSWPCYGTDTFT